ncbi:MAG: hypothetical protein C5S45_06945 [Candidatus Methanocomedens sp.]|nr:MAG: hypothetical protein C5S45_06945 [ANME-2 cluster archaeon]
MRTLRLFYSLALMAILLLVSGCTTVEVGELQTESRSVELENADSVDVILDMSNGEMIVSGGADTLLDAVFTYNVEAWKPEIEYNVIGGQGELIVRQPSVIGTTGLGAHNEWDLAINEDIPMDLSIDMSSGNCDFNMGSSLLKTLEIDSSSGNVDATLIGNQSLLQEVNIDMSSGAASLDLSGDYPSLSMMTIDSSSGNVDADLNGNYSSLSSVDIDLSSGNAFVDLSGNWESDAQVELAASSGRITLRLPRDVGVYVDAHTSSGNIDASGFRLDGDNYFNDAYGESNVTIHVKATVSSGNIVLQLVD